MRRGALPWTRRPKFSVIQRPQAVESPIQGHTPNCGCARVALSSVILAKRGSPEEGHGSTSSFPRQNQPGDSRAERENDVQELKCAAGCIRGRGSPSPPSFRGVRQYPVESHMEGQSSASSLPVQTIGGIPAQSARMTAIFSEPLSLPWWNQPGDSSPAYAGSE